MGCQNTQMLERPHKTQKACEAAGCEWVEIGKQVSKKLICRMSGYVRNQCHLDKESKSVDLSEVDAKTLGYIIQYLEILKGFSPEKLDQKHDKGRITKPIRETNILKCVHKEDLAEGEWIEGIFKKHDKRAIFDIILAANYMGMKPLLHLGCCKIATLIKGKTAEEIKDILSLESVPVDDGLAADVKSFAGLRRRLLKKLLGM